MSKKVLIELCMSPDLGGLELYMVRAAKALKNDFDVISLINQNGQLAQYYDGHDKCIELEKTSNLLMLGAALKLAKIIDKYEVDMIHLHWTKDIPFVVLAKQFSKKKPKIIQTRNMTMTRFKDDFYHKWLYKNIDLMLPVTYQVKDQLEKFIPLSVRPKIEVLYMGSDKVEKLPPQKLQEFKEKLFGIENKFHIGMVGRINEAKGQHLLIEAIAKLDDEVEAYFVGHEMEEGYIEKLQLLATSLGVESRVHFLGFMKNPHHFFQACDVMVLASKRETFGLVVIEAMQVGTAMVGSNSGGVVEIIDDEVTGLLFDVGDAVSLSQKLNLLYKDKNLLEKISKFGEEKAHQKFSSQIQFEKLVNILKKIV